MSKISKFVRNFIIGMVLNQLKDSKYVKVVLDKLKANKTLVGRVGIAIFTIHSAVKYYAPEYATFMDSNTEVIGIVLSWLALELGFAKDKQDALKEIAESVFDPSKPIDIDIGGYDIKLPAPEDFGFSKKTVTTDTPRNPTGEEEQVE